jgi:hypothetical protein
MWTIDLTYFEDDKCVMDSLAYLYPMTGLLEIDAAISNLLFYAEAGSPNTAYRWGRFLGRYAINARNNQKRPRRKEKVGTSFEVTWGEFNSWGKTKGDA